MRWKEQKAPLGFEPRISCLLDRRFNQLSHGATQFSSRYCDADIFLGWHIAENWLVSSIRALKDTKETKESNYKTKNKHLARRIWTTDLRIAASMTIYSPPLYRWAIASCWQTHNAIHYRTLDTPPFEIATVCAWMRSIQVFANEWPRNWLRNECCVKNFKDSLESIGKATYEQRPWTFTLSYSLSLIIAITAGPLAQLVRASC